MNKLELISTLSKEVGIPQYLAKDIIDVFFSEMSDTLASGDRVEIRGFCNFIVKKYAGYIGKNPKTGESVEVKPKKMPFFKCGKELKDRVNKNST